LIERMFVCSANSRMRSRIAPISWNFLSRSSMWLTIRSTFCLMPRSASCAACTVPSPSSAPDVASSAASVTRRALSRSAGGREQLLDRGRDLGGDRGEPLGALHLLVGGLLELAR